MTNKASPILAYNYTMSGSYFDSRMIGNEVYVVISQPANLYNGTRCFANRLQQRYILHHYASKHLLH